MSIHVPSIKLKPTGALMPQVGLGLYDHHCAGANEGGKYPMTLALNRYTMQSKPAIVFSTAPKIMTMRRSHTKVRAANIRKQEKGFDERLMMEWSSAKNSSSSQKSGARFMESTPFRQSRIPSRASVWTISI